MSGGPTMFVTDHAVLRYLDRVEGLDVEAIRARLQQQAQRMAGAAGLIGAEQYCVKAGEARLVCRSCNVVTVIRADEVWFPSA